MKIQDPSGDPEFTENASLVIAFLRAFVVLLGLILSAFIGGFMGFGPSGYALQAV